MCGRMAASASAGSRRRQRVDQPFVFGIGLRGDFAVEAQPEDMQVGVQARQGFADQLVAAAQGDQVVQFGILVGEATVRGARCRRAACSAPARPRGQVGITHAFSRAARGIGFQQQPQFIQLIQLLCG